MSLPIKDKRGEIMLLFDFIFLGFQLSEVIFNGICQVSLLTL